MSSWISDLDRWLSEEESLHNAQIVADYFGGLWTPQSISAMCGNMRLESSINPNIYEYGYNHSLERGYGLVQWTPATKLINWANERGMDWESGNTQLARINYEQENGIQWIATSTYDLSFNEFTESNMPIEYLTPAFTWCYERPNQEAGEQSLPERIAFAQRCYVELDFSGGGEESPPIDEKFFIIMNKPKNMRRRR